MKKALSIILAIFILTIQVAYAAPDISAPSAILIEKETGEILMEKNSHEKLRPASVTKVMTLLLIMEALDSGQISLTDKVSASENAASMGGSQIWLEQGEELTVEEMIKAIVVVSANDCAVAMAEFLAGSEEAFVDRMNKRAAELNMNDTSFVNCTGLDDKNEHFTSAHDIALMSRELLKHNTIKTYTTIWMDSLRNGESSLVNTNKLIRYYEGATGLKTGSTSKAKYCLSASAERGGMELIAVIMAADTSDQRFASAQTMLDFGFAGYTMVNAQPEGVLLPIPVALGKIPEVQPELLQNERIIVEKDKAAKIEREVIIASDLEAPVDKGQILGELKLTSDGQEIKKIPIIAADAVEKLGFWDVFLMLCTKLFLK